MGKLSGKPVTPLYPKTSMCLGTVAMDPQRHVSDCPDLAKFHHFGEISAFFFLKKMGQPRPLFRSFSVFSNKQYNFYNKSMWKNVMSIQYPAPGFELTTFGMWVSSHNHQTRAPALFQLSLANVLRAYLGHSIWKFCTTTFLIFNAILKIVIVLHRPNIE